jgi:uncharacterized HAD superfamily protein
MSAAAADAAVIQCAAHGDALSFGACAKRECAEACRNSLSQQAIGADHKQLTGDDAKVELTRSLLQHSLDNASQLRQDAPDRAVKQSPTLTTCATS